MTGELVEGVQGGEERALVAFGAMKLIGEPRAARAEIGACNRAKAAQAREAFGGIEAGRPRAEGARSGSSAELPNRNALGAAGLRPVHEMGEPDLGRGNRANGAADRQDQAAAVIDADDPRLRVDPE